MAISRDNSETRRTFWCPSTCFTLFIVISLLTHIAELFLNAVYTWFIQADVGNPLWTATILGFLLLPLVVTQLFSAILFLGRRDTVHKKKSVLVVALIHVLQVGFIWRHLSILNERNDLQRKKLLVDLLLLRLVFAFTSGLPLLSLQTFYIVTSNFYHGIQLAAMIMCLVSTSWALASFRRQNETCNIEKVVLTWPGIVFRLLWRTGEITARVVSIAVFASSYTYWTLLVFALHWLTMLICIWASILGTVNRKDFGRGSKLMICVAIGYVYTFTYLNFSHTRTKCRYICYYLIILLETAVLVASWLLHNPSWSENVKSVSLFVTIVSAFVLCVVSVIIYYTCFHIALSRLPKGNGEVCVKDECINCKLSLCTKHSTVLQRPFNAGWTSQYQTAVYSGHYYRNVLQDSLFDSASELEDRFHGNASFNDREVELIMETGASESNIVDVISESQNNLEEHFAVVEQHHEQSPSQELGVPVSATSTVKSSLDLYNNLDNLQSDKSNTSSSLLKDKSFRDTASVNNSLLQMDSEFWNRDGLTEKGGLSGYNLPVSYIGHGSKKQQPNGSSVLNHNDLAASCEMVEVVYNNVCSQSADLSVEDNRDNQSGTSEYIVTHCPNAPRKFSDLEVTGQYETDKNTHSRYPRKTDISVSDDQGCVSSEIIEKGLGVKRATGKRVVPWCPDEASTNVSEEESKDVCMAGTNNVPGPVDYSHGSQKSPARIEVPGDSETHSSATASFPTNGSPVNLDDSSVSNDLQFHSNNSSVPIDVSPITAIGSPVVIQGSYFDDSDSDCNPEMII